MLPDNDEEARLIRELDLETHPVFIPAAASTMLLSEALDWSREVHAIAARLSAAAGIGGDPVIERITEFVGEDGVRRFEVEFDPNGSDARESWQLVRELLMHPPVVEERLSEDESEDVALECDWITNFERDRMELFRWSGLVVPDDPGVLWDTLRDPEPLASAREASRAVEAIVSHVERVQREIGSYFGISMVKRLISKPDWPEEFAVFLAEGTGDSDAVELLREAIGYPECQLAFARSTTEGPSRLGVAWVIEQQAAYVG